MEQMYITRLEHVCSRLTKMGLTQMIVSDPLSIRYLTGVWVDLRTSLCTVPAH